MAGIGLPGGCCYTGRFGRFSVELRAAAQAWPTRRKGRCRSGCSSEDGRTGSASEVLNPSASGGQG